MTRRRYFYAVASGRSPGVYTTWKEVQVQVRGYPNSLYKKFSVQSDAEEFVRRKQPTSITLTLKEVESFQSIKKMSCPPKVGVSKRKPDDDNDKKSVKKSKN